MKQQVKSNNLSGLFKVLGDDTRLRILLLLQKNELSVGELQQILTVSQSALSSHLALLRDSELVTTRKEGQKVFYLFSQLEETDPSYQIINQALHEAEKSVMLTSDKESLEHVLWQRAESSTSFFDNKGKGHIPPGQTAETLFQGFLQLFPGKLILDMEYGTGSLTLTLAKNERDVIGIDSSVSQLKHAKAKIKELENITKKRPDTSLGTLKFQLGQMEDSGLQKDTFDMVILSQALHHVAKPLAVLQEAIRLLKPAGKILILDLLSHQQDWMREKFGDFWLGFTHKDINDWLKQAGFKNIQITDAYDTQAPKGIKTLIVTGEK